ncbi:MAG: ABC transporter ATP-binding protein/permease [Coriobacteriia bacterium]|nr:ABC transporter ATP-binding protein/permease [Coriobacteriia bacterium]
MLELKNISKSYVTGPFSQKALDGISVSFRDSEFVAVLGPSGSGKTTMLNVIGGLDHYDSGDLLINGVSTKKFNDKDWDAYRNHEVGFVFQNYNLIPHQSVLSNVELALTLSGISPSERKRRAEEALTKVGLADHIHKKPNQLSGGQMQRVAIARALVNNPSIIFADEPTGALDTKTSVQIMEILKDVSEDKLVVMVTHNPMLAEMYATRTVKLQDGKIIDDSSPYEGFEVKAKAKKSRTAMSFLTALSLSFANLMGKKGRTFMTAFAGSIGIIGISAILALSTGTQAYIENVETNTLAQYPLTITRTKSAISGISEAAQGGSLAKTIEKMQYNQNEGDTAKVRATLSTLLSASGANDLKSFKSYLDSNPQDLDSYVKSMEYSYNTTPKIYSEYNGNVRQVYPSTMYGQNSNSSTSSAQTTSSNPMAKFTSMESFGAMPKDKTLYEDQYSVAAGRWPEKDTECVLVLHQDGSIADSLLYTLGFRDPEELENAIKKYSRDEKVSLPEKFDPVRFSDILGKKFKLVKASDCYQKELGIWVDKSDDEAFMKGVYEKSEDLTIVGIINAPEGRSSSLSLSAGINYPYSLLEKSINAAADSQIVKEQLNDSNFDVLSGKTFAEEKENGFDGSAFNDIVEFNAEALAGAIKVGELPSFTEADIASVIEKAVDEKTIAQIISGIAGNKGYSEAMQKILTGATATYIKYIAEGGTLTPDIYFTKGNPGYEWVENACSAAGLTLSEEVLKDIYTVSGKILEAFTSSLMQQFSKLQNNFLTFDASALSNVFKFNLTEEKLMAISKVITGAATRTYESNLSNFGYADLTNPAAVTIYPNNFNSKESITQIIESYNEEVGETKAISYTDIAKLLMTSLTTMIDMITAALIAFVAISLVVSSIMIGIITYISVLERRREIGILRAIGARKRDIFRVFNAETFIVGLIAGVIGIVIVYIGCIPANIIARAAFNAEYDIAFLPIWSALFMILISVGLTFVAGLIPSSSAAKKDPVEAINS